MRRLTDSDVSWTRLYRGDKPWISISVQGAYKGLTAVATINECDYRDERDFASSVYYKFMRKDVLASLQAQVDYIAGST